MLFALLKQILILQMLTKKVILPHVEVNMVTVLPSPSATSNFPVKQDTLNIIAYLRHGSLKQELANCVKGFIHGRHCNHRCAGVFWQTLQ